MMILHSDGLGMTNMDAVCEIKPMGRYIRAYGLGGENHPLAKYETDERAEAVFKNNIVNWCRINRDGVIILPEE